MPNPPAIEHKPVVVVSACLVGLKCRYDGTHRRDNCIADLFSQHMQIVPVCPEVGIGLSVPRPPLELRVANNRIMLWMDAVKEDLAPRMRRWGKRWLTEVSLQNSVDGAILKSRSPSCGLSSPVMTTQSRQAKQRPGIFAQLVLSDCPQLPIIEEQQLHEPQQRNWWLERVFARCRYRTFQSNCRSVGELRAFHERHQLQLAAHNSSDAKQIGAFLKSGRPLRQLLDRYGKKFQHTLARPSTRTKHCRVLRKVLAELKQVLSPPEYQAAAKMVEAFGNGSVLLDDVIANLRFLAQAHDRQDLLTQTYLFPPLSQRLLSYPE